MRVTDSANQLSERPTLIFLAITLLDTQHRRAQQIVHLSRPIDSQLNVTPPDAVNLHLNSRLAWSMHTLQAQIRASAQLRVMDQPRAVGLHHRSLIHRHHHHHQDRRRHPLRNQSSVAVMPAALASHVVPRKLVASCQMKPSPHLTIHCPSTKPVIGAERSTSLASCGTVTASANLASNSPHQPGRRRHHQLRLTLIHTATARTCQQTHAALTTLDASIIPTHRPSQCGQVIAVGS